MSNLTHEYEGVSIVAEPNSADGDSWMLYFDGKEEPQYEAVQLYRVLRRDEPSQTFEYADGGVPFAGFDKAVEFCEDDASDVAFENGLDDVGAPSLNFFASSREDGVWVAREFDTIGSDWRIEEGRMELRDLVFGSEYELIDPDELFWGACERIIDGGWY